MKKQLNLICVLIFFFVGLSLVPSIYSMGNAFVDGFKEGMSQAEEGYALLREFGLPFKNAKKD